nr:hypothetical protein [Paraburkholderia elongata]
MAICEYLAERFPDRLLWPQDVKKRAHARSICLEMHAGFTHMRRELHLDICMRDPVAGKSALGIAEVRWDVQRVEQIWETCLAQYGGPFLFGGFSIADAYFAPVTLRFLTYGLSVSSRGVTDYMNKIPDLKPVKEWVAEAMREQRR